MVKKKRARQISQKSLKSLLSKKAANAARDVLSKEKLKIIRIPTGIPGFDKLIEGGVEVNSVNLIVGGSGTGKTVFSTQFLMEGLKKGDACLFVTFEETKKEFYSNALTFGWDLDEYEKKNKFFFLEYSPEKVMAMLEEGGGEIESIVTKYNIKRMAMDSVSSFALLFNDELAKRESALVLFEMIRRWNVTSLLTLQEDAESRGGGYTTSLEFEADSIVLLYFIRNKGKRERFIEVLKMRGTNHSTKTYPLEMGKHGVNIGLVGSKEE